MGCLEPKCRSDALPSTGQFVFAIRSEPVAARSIPIEIVLQRGARWTQRRELLIFYDRSAAGRGPQAPRLLPLAIPPSTPTINFLGGSALTELKVLIALLRNLPNWART